MAIALVQSKSTKGVGVSTVACTFNTTPIAHNAVHVGVSGWARAWAAGKVTDNKSNTYAMREHPDGTNVHAGIYDCLDIASSATFTVTGAPTGASQDTDIAIHEYSGLSTTGFDKSANASGTDNTYETGTTAATTQADELCFAVATSEGTTGTPTVASPYTMQQNIVTASNMPLMTADNIVASTGAQSTVFSNNTQPWVACVATYKAAGAADPFPALPHAPAQQTVIRM